MTKQLSLSDYLELLNYSYNSKEETVKKQLKILNSDIAEYEKKMSVIYSLLEIQKKDTITLRKSKKENLLHIDKFKKENKELIKKLSGLKLRTKELEDKKHITKSLINEHEEYVYLIADLKKDSNKKASKISSKNIQFNSLKTDVESLKDDSKFHENLSKSFSNSALERIQEELKNLKKENANLQRKITIRKNKSLSTNSHKIERVVDPNEESEGFAQKSTWQKVIYFYNIIKEIGEWAHAVMWIVIIIVLAISLIIYLGNLAS